MKESEKILIRDLMSSTEQCLLDKGHQKSTLGVYKATWNRYLYFSTSEYYDRKTAELFLSRYFGVDVNSSEQRLDSRMRHALRHMNALDEFRKTGDIPRKKMRNQIKYDETAFNLFFADYLAYCRQQKYSASWFSNTYAALRVFLVAIHQSGVTSVEGIDESTIHAFVDIISDCLNICPNVRRSRSKQVAVYLQWLYEHGFIQHNLLHLLPNIKRTPQLIPQVWTADEIQRILSVIDTANPVGKRNYAIFLLLARTGLRISDVVGLKHSNIDWKNNCISMVQQKTGNPLSIPLSKEIGVAIISYLKYGRPTSDSEIVFLSHNAPFQPLNAHNNFHAEMRKYMRRAGINFEVKRHSGVHTIRSSFATNMLKNGASLGSISQILGHSDINVTGTYLRVDIEQLRICGLGLEVTR